MQGDWPRAKTLYAKGAEQKGRFNGENLEESDIHGENDLIAPKMYWGGSLTLANNVYLVVVGSSYFQKIGQTEFYSKWSIKRCRHSDV